MSGPDWMPAITVRQPGQMDEACFACWNGEPCPVCEGKGTCDPVPAKGQQAIPWKWTP